jgi:hypothetical protein
LSQANEETSVTEKRKAEGNYKVEHACSFCGDKFETRLELTTHKRAQHGVV